MGQKVYSYFYKTDIVLSTADDSIEKECVVSSDALADVTSTGACTLPDRCSLCIATEMWAALIRE